MCRHIHIKDSCPGEDGRFQYVAPGSGTFPHLELIETLAAEKYSGYISLEWERHWFPILPPVQVPLSSFLALYRANLPSFA